MKLIIGLGNPGKKYAKTRHNAGFLTIDYLQLTINDFSPWKLEKKFKAEISKGEIEGEEIILAKPQTFMNNSGEAVKLLTTHYLLLTTNNLWVVHDDIDLPLGKIRISFRAGSAGHKGAQSIIDALGGKNFWRLRIGIKPDSDSTAIQGKIEKFVLKSFRKEEQKLLKETLDRAVEALILALREPEKAMSLHN